MTLLHKLFDIPSHVQFTTIEEKYHLLELIAMGLPDAFAADWLENAKVNYWDKNPNNLVRRHDTAIKVKDLIIRAFSWGKHIGTVEYWSNLYDRCPYSMVLEAKAKWSLIPRTEIVKITI